MFLARCKHEMGEDTAALLERCAWSGEPTRRATRRERSFVRCAVVVTSSRVVHACCRCVRLCDRVRVCVCVCVCVCVRVYVRVRAASADVAWKTNGFGETDALFGYKRVALLRVGIDDWLMLLMRIMIMEYNQILFEVRVRARAQWWWRLRTVRRADASLSLRSIDSPSC
jgi:hypothetical protein